MIFARTSLGGAALPQRPAPLRAALWAAEHLIPEGLSPGMEVQQRLVLRTLVEDFGGEVTYSALTRHLSHQPGRTWPTPGPRLIDVLQGLQRCDALSLEPNGANDFIVRLLPDGADQIL